MLSGALKGRTCIDRVAVAAADVAVRGFVTRIVYTEGGLLLLVPVCLFASGRPAVAGQRRRIPMTDCPMRGLASSSRHVGQLQEGRPQKKKRCRACKTRSKWRGRA
jgi:UPF0716 family protein affecting phage T7 exclusion